MAGELEAVRPWDAEQQRPDRAGAPPGAGLPPADDDLLRLQVLDLEPAVGAFAGVVAGVEPLHHDALEALRLRGRENRVAVAFEVRRRLPRRTGQPERLQHAASFDV